MAEADLSKIVSLIMENPKLIEEIKGLAEEKNEPVNENTENTERQAQASEVLGATYEPVQNAVKLKRRDLLSALKPYVSEERGRAIDSMMSLSDIFDMIKTR